MIKNYLTVALRNLIRHKGQTAIIAVGLAVGLACAILIFSFVQQERSYDRFHEQADRIYRITYEETSTPAQRHLPTVSPPVGPTLAATYPEVTAFVRLRDPHRSLFTRGDVRFYESRFFYADSAFFDVFTFPLAQGNPRTALAPANTIVLTQEAARKYFGAQDPMGQVLTMNGAVGLTVTGVLEPLPLHSHLQFDFLVSFSTFRVPFGYPVTLESWGWISFHTYVLLAEGTEAALVEAKLPAFMAAHFDGERAANARLRLQPLTNIYLGPLKHPSMASGNTSYVYGLSGIALLILLLAGFNFTNLSTAHALRRHKEVSLRKVLGARPGHLIRQYLGESVLMALLSLALALCLVEGSTEAARRFADGSLPSGNLATILPLFLAVTVLIGLLAGSYPALVLSRLRPAAVLKGGVGEGLSAGRMRGSLVVLQFAIAITLMAGTFVVARQMDFIRTKALGFAQEQVLALHGPGDELLSRYPVLKERLLQNSNVLSVTKGGAMFDGDQGSVPIYPEGGDDQDAYAMNIYSMYFDFIETLGIDVLEGRAPSEAFPTDSAGAVLLNRTAADLLAATVPGWDDPIGKSIRVDLIMEGRVIGIVDDFHFASLHSEIEPLVLYFPRTAIDKVFLRVRPGAIPDLLASLEQDWQQVFPAHPFSFTFLDAYLDQLYRADRRFARLVSVFSFLTILLACLGLYGLVAFVTQLRTKEIGIRKVLGASVPGLLVLLSKRFLLYVVVANILAWPLAYLGMRMWLDNFAYRIEMRGSEFLMAGLAALGIALLTMSYQAIRAALADPVKSLRYE